LESDGGRYRLRGIYADQPNALASIEDDCVAINDTLDRPPDTSGFLGTGQRWGKHRESYQDQGVTRQRGLDQTGQ